MSGFDKTSVAVASAGNIQFVAAAEVSQQPAVFLAVTGMVALEAVQFLICQPGQVFLHARTMKITGQMGAKGNAACLTDYLHYFCDCREIWKAQIVFRRKDTSEKIIHIAAEFFILQISQCFPAAAVGIIAVSFKLCHGKRPAPLNQIADAVIIFLLQQPLVVTAKL